LFQRVKFVSILSIIECNIWNRQWDDLNIIWTRV
jgi:hypothetical protein